MIQDKLKDVCVRFEDISMRLADPDTVSNSDLYTQLAKEHADLAPVVAAYQEIVGLQSELENAREMLDENDDDEMRSLIKTEIDSLLTIIPKKEEALKIMLIPKDPLDARNIILEIRAGTGGDEASLFSGDLFNMYSRYATRQGWNVEIISDSPGTVGGYKEIVCMITGTDVYGRLKFEAGTHRVQRVPETESQGRVHTSACTVAILPEAEEVDVDIKDSDLRIDTYRASGAGGQHVNKTSSAIRITHIPTGIVVTSQDERSQHKNRSKALKVLMSRLLDSQRTKATKERADVRKNMVGSGDRSERIRTYNYPQNRITDHRINLTVYSLDNTVSTGDLDEIVDSLLAADQLERMRESGLDA